MAKKTLTVQLSDTAYAQVMELASYYGGVEAAISDMADTRVRRLRKIGRPRFQMKSERAPRVASQGKFDQAAQDRMELVSPDDPNVHLRCVKLAPGDVRFLWCKRMPGGKILSVDPAYAPISVDIRTRPAAHGITMHAARLVAASRPCAPST